MAERSIAAALEEALRGCATRPEDGATVALARRYAADLDEASVVSATVTKALRELLALDPELHDRFLTLAVRIEDTAVLASIGPKLLAALEQLGMTPRARAAVGKGGAQRDDDRGGEHADDCRCLPCLRKRRSARRDGATAVDPSAP